ncbi:MAG: glycosyltransferase [Opitutaceae bacterium]
MIGDLNAGLRRRRPDLRIRWFKGLFTKYAGGGLRPPRLVNLAYMYFALPFVLLVERPDIILVRTAPPGIQLWACLLGKMRGTRVGCWLMDYHPEIEASSMARHAGLRWLASLLRRVDRFFLRRMDFAIVLDEAMENLVRTRAPRLPLVQHPTWNNRTGFQPRTEPIDGELRLVYAGNLGHSHPLATFEALLQELKRRGRVRLVTVGASAGGESRFGDLAKRAGIALQCLPRTPFGQLGRLFDEHRIHAGLVFLSDETAGLVSPSKFSAYIRYGLPTVYVGPGGTSSEAVCLKFGAGFSLRNRAGQPEIEAAAAKLWDEKAMAEACANTRRAVDFFGAKNGETLAESIVPFFEKLKHRILPADTADERFK